VNARGCAFLLVTSIVAAFSEVSFSNVPYRGNMESETLKIWERSFNLFLFHLSHKNERRKELQKNKKRRRVFRSNKEITLYGIDTVT
jgi:hypothetical protein